MIYVNGEPTAVADDATVADLLRSLDVDPGRRGIAVAVEGEVVPRSAWGDAIVARGARVEIVSAVQGG